MSDLQEETRALWHENDSDERGQGGEETHQDEEPPAVELELCTDGEAPAWQTIRQLIFQGTIFLAEHFPSHNK